MSIIGRGSFSVLLNLFILVWHIPMYQAKMLSEELWEANIDIAEQLYDTKFIQGIKENKLDKQIFLQFHLPDILYVETTAVYIRQAVEQCGSGETCQFLQSLQKEYEDYLPGMLKAAGLKNTDSIETTPAFDAYAEHYKMVASDMDPAYMVVALYPCSRLWQWFAKRLKEETGDNNVYRTWIEDNTLETGGLSIDEFINAYSDFDKNDVHNVFRISMEKEYHLFVEASNKIKSAITKDEF